MSTHCILRAVRLGEGSAVVNTRRGQALDVDSGVQGGSESQAVQGTHKHPSSQGGVGCSPALRDSSPRRGLRGAAVPTGGRSPP